MQPKTTIDIENAIRIIEEDYRICFRTIGKFYDYLDTFGLKEFNKYSQYKWSYDRDRKNGYSYVCIRWGGSLSKKCLIKKRACMEDADLYKWVEHKKIIEEALDEAWQYVYKEVNAVKSKIEDLKETMKDYEEKLDEISEEYDEAKQSKKGQQESSANAGKNR